MTICWVARSHAPAAGAVASGGTRLARGLDRAGAVGGEPVTVIPDDGGDDEAGAVGSEGAVGGEPVMVIPDDVDGVTGGEPVCAEWRPDEAQPASTAAATTPPAAANQHWRTSMSQAYPFRTDHHTSSGH
ncbi:MAG TPA: hypothetical protein VGL21_02035 [Jatrophihabitantaceae bacterium]